LELMKAVSIPAKKPASSKAIMSNAINMSP
jgi:hypothetical protein